MKKRLGLLLTLVMISGALVGCTKTSDANKETKIQETKVQETKETEEVVKITAEELLEQAKKNLEEANSYKSNMGIDLQLTIAAQGMTVDMDMNMTMNYNVDKAKELQEFVATMAMKYLGQEENESVRAVIVGSGEDRVQYVEENGVWSKEEEKIDTVEGGTVKTMLSLLESDKEFELLEKTKKIDKKECYIIEMEIDSKGMATLLESSTFGAEGSFANAFGAGNIDDMVVGGTVQLAIEKDSGNVILCTVEMNEYFSEIFTQMMKKENEGIEFSVDAKVATLEWQISKYNEEIEIEVPTVE